VGRGVSAFAGRLTPSIALEWELSTIF
jgi:hypothetical protein